MSQIDKIKEKIRELQNEVDLLEQGTNSCKFWQNLLNDIGSDNLIVKNVETCFNMNNCFMIDTNKVNEFGRFNTLHNAGYYVDAFRHVSGNGSRFWINKF